VTLFVLFVLLYRRLEDEDEEEETFATVVGLSLSLLTAS
jgi:hypothetical protein